MGGRGAGSASGKRSSGAIKNRGITMGQPGTGLQITSEGRTNGQIYFVDAEGKYRRFDSTNVVLSDAVVQKLMSNGKAQFLKESEMNTLRQSRASWTDNKPGYELYGYDASDLRGRDKLVYRPRRQR